VPRKSKTPADNKPADDAAATPSNGATTAAEPKKKSRAVPSSEKKKKPAPPKKSAGKKSKAPASLPPAEPTDEEIRIRAYFIAERRHRLSLPGDSNLDWIEARRQLIEESRR
jgi:Protein of unknown function (DUF2934).